MICEFWRRTNLSPRGRVPRPGVGARRPSRKPPRKSAVIGIDFAPIADAQRDDAAEQQPLVRNRIENRAECAALFVAARDVSVESVADRCDQKNRDGGEALPLQRRAALNAL